MIERDLSRKEQKEYEVWLKEMQDTIRPQPDFNEDEVKRSGRIAFLLEHYEAFCKYYFPDYCTAEFAWFHKKAAKLIRDDNNINLVAEWPREHAKSVQFDIFEPLYLKARGELSGLIIASSNEEKAEGLLADLQEQLMFNSRYTCDFGKQYKAGKWDSGKFITQDGCGFWAFGRGQSPRGARSADKRPNLIIVDDIDDMEVVKNEKRVEDATDWVLGDLYGCGSIEACRFIVAGNRIHKHSILAHIVGDLDEGDPKKKSITHLKVYALENPKTHKKDLSTNGVPAWKERYTRDEILDKMQTMGRRIALREFFHEHIVIGRIFREDMLPWAKLPPISKCKKIVTYCDPSYKDTKKNDFKYIVLVGKNGEYYDIYDCFGRQCTTAEMVRGHYNLAESVPEGKTCQHWMEANFIQDIHLKQYDEESKIRGYSIGIRGDKRKKPDKTDRIENLSAYAERGQMRFNQDKKQTPDMIELRQQFLGFPDAEHDDGPDAVEGAVYKLNTPSMYDGGGIATTRYIHSNARRAY